MDLLAGLPSLRRVGLGLFAATILLSLLALGSVHVVVLAIVAISLFVSGVLLKPRSIPVAPTALLLGLGAWSLVQSIPMPVAWLSYISPHAADIWSSALSPLGEQTSMGSISLAPSNSIIEALKWTAYAAVFLLAHSVTRRYGSTVIPLIIFGSGTVLALVSLGHWLADAHRVFGIYAPRFATAPGHVAPLLNPNNLGGYLVFAALCGTALLAAPSTGIRPAAVVLAVATCVCAALITQSRGAMASLVIGAVTLGLFRGIHHARAAERSSEGRVRGGTILAVLGGVATAILLVVVFERHGFAELLDPSTEKFGFSYWSLDVIKDYPLVGVGRGAIGSVSFEYLSRRGFMSSQFGQTENFVSQWCAEWGMPVGLAACAGLGAALWSIGRRAVRSPMLQSSFAALFALILQNFVDLAFEVAGVMISLVALLGASLSTKPRAQRSKAASRSAYTRVALAMGPAAAIAAAWYGAPTDVELHDDLRRLVVAKPSHTTNAEVNSKLRSAMARFPADPFYPYLGAVHAMSSGNNPLPWFQKALVRNAGSGPTHLMLAEYMKARGNYNQALLHLRLAIEHDLPLMGAATARAVSWQRNHDDLLRAVPRERSDLATRTLMLMAGKVGTPQAKLQLLREAVSRSPQDPVPLAQTVSLLLKMTGDSKGGCAANRAEACLDEASRLAKRLEAVQPGSSVPSEARASVLLYKKDPKAAEELLRKECPARGGTVSCLELWLKAVEATGDSKRFSSAAEEIALSGCARPASCYAWHMSIAERAARNRWWGQALEHSSEAASLKPSAQVWMVVAKSASELGLESRARLAYRKALELTDDGKLKSNIMKHLAETSLHD